MTETDNQVTVTEGDPLTVKCTYSLSGSPYLFWYVQYPNWGLQFLLKYMKEESLVKGSFGFEAEFNKSQSSFNFKKWSVVGSDAAVYFCAGRVTVLGAAGTAALKSEYSQHHFPAAFIPCTRGWCGSRLCHSLSLNYNLKPQNLFVQQIFINPLCAKYRAKHWS